MVHQLLSKFKIFKISFTFAHLHFCFKAFDFHLMMKITLLHEIGMFLL